MARKLLLMLAAVSAAGVAALGLAIPGNAASPKLIATVTDDSVITLTTPMGRPVRTLRAGGYTVAVRDQTSDHNFRLAGSGVRRATGVEAVVTTAWGVRFRKGKRYVFQCDPHASSMRGALRAR